MTQGANRPRSDNVRLQQIIGEYLHELECGEELSQRLLIEQHPDLADELTAFFSQHDSHSQVTDVCQQQHQANHSELPTVPPGNSNSEGVQAASNTPTTSESPTLAHDMPPPDNESSGSPLGTKVRYFGDYELLEEIARGGMGVVYKARQVSLNRIVALKMILAGQLASEEDVQRFHAEAESAANLDHPGIVPIHEVGEYDGQHYFSMGFVDGESLAEKIKDGPLPPREAAEYTQRIAEAIAFAHEHGVIHRDLKPGNVLLDHNGDPKVTDFGLAKTVADDSGLTATGQILGTPSYMPPEQAAGRHKEVSERADVYALGAVLYALVTGRPPFQSDNQMDTLIQVLEQQPLPPRLLNRNVPRDLDAVCLKCLEKNPNDRYATAAELASDLKCLLDGRPIRARPVSDVARLWSWTLNNPLITTGILLVFLPVAYVFVSSLFSRRLGNPLFMFEGFQKSFTQEAMGKPWVFLDLEATFTRVFIGLVVGLVLGVVLGLLLRYVRQLRAIVVPFLRNVQTPYVAVIILFVLLPFGFVLFGTDYLAEVIIAIAVIPTFALAISKRPEQYTLTRSQPTFVDEFVEVLETLRFQFVLGLGLALMCEYLIGDAGIGYRVRLQSRLLNMGVIYVHIVALLVVCLFCDSAVAGVVSAIRRGIYVHHRPVLFGCVIGMVVGGLGGVLLGILARSWIVVPLLAIASGHLGAFFGKQIDERRGIRETYRAA